MTTGEATTAATVAAQGAHCAPEKGKAKKVTSRPKNTPKAAKAGKGGTAKKKAAKPRNTPATSKTAEILELLRRKNGVTLAEIMKATGWQAHSVRGFLSGAIRKKMGLTVVSSKDEGGERSYSVKA